MHIEDFLDWLDGVEDYFECMGLEEHLKVCLVTYKLKGGSIFGRTRSHYIIASDEIATQE